MILRQFARHFLPSVRLRHRFSTRFKQRGNDDDEEWDEKWMALGSAMLVIPGLVWIRQRYERERNEEPLETPIDLTDAKIISDLTQIAAQAKEETVAEETIIAKEAEEIGSESLLPINILVIGEGGKEAVQWLREEQMQVLWCSQAETAMDDHRVVSIDAKQQTATMASGRIISWQKLLITPSASAELSVNGGIVGIVGGDLEACELAVRMAQQATSVKWFLKEHAPLANLLPKYLATWIMGQLRQQHSNLQIYPNVTMTSAPKSEQEGLMAELTEGLTGLPGTSNSIRLAAEDGREWWVDQLIQMGGESAEVKLAEAGGLEISSVEGHKRKSV